MKNIILCGWLYLGWIVPVSAQVGQVRLLDSLVSDANVIVVMGVSLVQICDSLAAAGYKINYKEKNLVVTEKTMLPKYGQATYSIYANERTDTVYLWAKVHVEAEPAIGDTMAKYVADTVGTPEEKGFLGYPFKILLDFAQLFKQQIGFARM